MEELGRQFSHAPDSLQAAASKQARRCWLRPGFKAATCDEQSESSQLLCLVVSGGGSRPAFFHGVMSEVGGGKTTPFEYMTGEGRRGGQGRQVRGEGEVRSSPKAETTVSHGQFGLLPASVVELHVADCLSC